MSTNYYEALRNENGEVREGRHIGKKASAGEERLVFTWAVQPGALEGIDAFVDEYGETYTSERFHEVLRACAENDFRFVGQEFT